VEQELERRIANIMENERCSHDKAMKEAEREILEVSRSLAAATANCERMQKELVALQSENKVYLRQVSTLFEEKAALAVEMQDKLEAERLKADAEARSALDQIEDLTEKVRNLEFTLENSRTRAQDFEERYT